jgi:hypothetical protein
MPLLILLLVDIVCAVGCAAIRGQKGGNPLSGALMGFLLGPLGIVLALVLGSGTVCPFCSPLIPSRSEGAAMRP